MDNLTSLVEGIVSQLGRAFFLRAFLPLLIGVVLNQYIIFAPAYADVEAVWNLFPAVASPWLGLLSGEMLTTLTVTLLLSLALVPLNMLVIRFFEGFVPGMKAVLYPFYARRLSQHRKWYAPIQAKRAERRRMLAGVEETGDYDPDADFAVQEELHRLHAQREEKEPLQILPYDRENIAPTMFGNAWAVMEEHPLVRYGMDGTLFWPYVRTAMIKENPELLAQIDNQKLQIDITTHLALVMGIVAVEGLVFAGLRFQLAMLLLAVVCSVLFWTFYRAGVSYTQTLGIMIAQSFDLYRLSVLDAFDLARPEDLDEEYWIWTRLSAFLRRGEPFYFDLLPRAGEEEEEETE